MATAKEIEETAGDWAARIDRCPLSADEERALEQWIASDSRHRGAFMRMRAVALHSERARALGPGFDPDIYLGERRSRWALGKRRPQIWIGLAAILVALTCGLWLFAGAERFDTRQGEVRVVPLSDGSVMTLNTSSRAQVAISKDAREIRLLQGEALFDVAKDRTRPFVVIVGDTAVRAIGTSFTVERLTGQPIRVLVREGVVEVQAPASALPARLTANMRAEVRPAAVGGNELRPEIVATPIAPAAMNRELAWRDGRLAFEAETLADAAAAFARYSAVRIVIDDPDVAAREITGLFTANDPISFARAAATSLGLQVEVHADEVRLTRRTP